MLQKKKLPIKIFIEIFFFYDYFYMIVKIKKLFFYFLFFNVYWSIRPSQAWNNPFNKFSSNSLSSSFFVCTTPWNFGELRRTSEDWIKVSSFLPWPTKRDALLRILYTCQAMEPLNQKNTGRGEWNEEKTVSTYIFIQKPSYENNEHVFCWHTFDAVAFSIKTRFSSN